MSLDTSSLPDALAGPLDLLLERFRESAEPEQVKTLCTRQEVPGVWAVSEFIANWCIRYPDRCADLIRDGRLDRPVVADDLSSTLAGQLEEVTDEAGLDRILRQFRNTTMVRIAWRDLAGMSSLDETMASVSALAECCIDQALAAHYGWLVQRHGLPRDRDGQGVEMVVLGLGKLGGGELNYSSDIDLMFAYEGAGQTDGGSAARPRPLDNQEFFIKLGRKLVSSLNRADADGFVFRTDMRLRPNGDSGPLVLSFAAMEHYYQTHGRNWERYALIKARVVGGDRQSGAALLEMLRPFVYRKYLDYSAFEAVREMKSMIERELASERNQRDVKLGRGGIREVEFLVQNYQLIRGGRETSLQTPSLYTALEELVRFKVLGEADRDALQEAYVFLRNVEHRLQMVADRQTQTLPDSAFEQTRLAFSMGCDHWQAFRSALDTRRKCIHEYFRSLLGVSGDDGTGAEPTDNDFSGCWSDSAQIEQALVRAGVENAGRVATLLEQFSKGGLYRTLSATERDRLDRLMPLALTAAGDMVGGDRAIAGLISVIEAIGHRSVYLSLLIENPGALAQLLQLCGASPWISRHIGRNPVVLDELLGPLGQEQEPDRGQLVEALNHRLAQVEPDDVEEALNALREFYHAQVLRIAAADVRKQYDYHQVQRLLTELSEVILEHVLEDAAATIADKQGPPPGQLGIIAYGKFAGYELGYHSDLDIVVCFEAAENIAHGTAEYYFSRVGQRLIHLITTRTRAGVLFELDMRLRPSGRSGTLVTSLDSFADYQRTSAWTWEHQALVRARMVLGSGTLRERFEEIRRDVLCTPRDEEELRKNIASMRSRMVKNNSKTTEQEYDIKLDYGGIVDIEFLLQYLVLRHAPEIPAIIAPRSTSELIEVLARHGLLDSGEQQDLAAIWDVYLERSLYLKLMDQPVLVPQTTLRDERSRVIAIWTRVFGADSGACPGSTNGQ